jgi:hypothetical protein
MRRGAVQAQAVSIDRERAIRSLQHRLGKQRGAKDAQIDLARRLAEAIWQMLTRDQPFAPAGAADPPGRSRSACSGRDPASAG